MRVAPHVGAWIETPLAWIDSASALSHPMWVRGLKQYGFGMPKLQCESHPMWVRGLKLFVFCRFRLYRRRTPCGCVD